MKFLKKVKTGYGDCNGETNIKYIIACEVKEKVRKKSIWK